jgi:hypothetical protein
MLLFVCWHQALLVDVCKHMWDICILDCGIHQLNMQHKCCCNSSS